MARIVQRSPAWLTNTITLYNTQGPDGLADRRPGRSHHPFLLNEIQREALDLRLQSPPDDEGKWTSQKVADWIEATLGQPVHVTTGWNYLRRLTYTVQQPRPRHPQAATAEQQEAYKKNPDARRRPEDGASGPPSRVMVSRRGTARHEKRAAALLGQAWGAAHRAPRQ